jgi:hypothetical protein
MAMKNNILNRKRYVYYFMMALLSLYVLIVISILVLNYTGYCFKQQRYISRDEVIHAAINELLTSHYSPDIRRYTVKNGKTILEQPKEKNRIYYKSVDEFLMMNPNCCEFERFTLPSLWFIYLKGALKGRNLTAVKINYKVRYYDGNGNIKEYQHPRNVYVRLTNCGRVLYK